MRGRPLIPYWPREVRDATQGGGTYGATGAEGQARTLRRRQRAVSAGSLQGSSVLAVPLHASGRKDARDGAGPRRERGRLRKPRGRPREGGRAVRLGAGR